MNSNHNVQAQRWLDQRCANIAGVRRAVLCLEDGATSMSWPEEQPAPTELLAAAMKVLGTGAPNWHSGGRDGSYHTCLAVPVSAAPEQAGAVCLELDSTDREQRIAALRSLTTAASPSGADSPLNDHLPQRSASAPDPPDSQPGTETQAQLLAMIAHALEQHALQPTAMAVAAGLARDFAAHRVSIALGPGGNGALQLVAVSDSPGFDRRSSLAGELLTALQECATNGQTLWTPNADPSSPQTAALDWLARRHSTDALCATPLVHDGEVLGAVLLERNDAGAFSGRDCALLEVMATAVAPILALRRQAEAPLWRRWSRSWRNRGTGVLRRTALYGALAAALLFVGLVPSSHQVAADATIEPFERRAVVAPVTGFIADARHRAGDIVTRGTELARLDTRDLELERLRWDTELNRLAKELRSAVARRDRTGARILKSRQDQARAQRQLTDELIKRSRLLAPIDGVIISGDLSDAFGSPVERGDLLFEVAPRTNYRVVLRVDERDISQIRPDQSGAVTLVGAPDAPIAMRVRRLVPLSEAAGGINAFPVEAELLLPPDGLLPGMTGVARVTVGERSLGWVWGHRLFDWLRLQWWRLGG